MPWPPSARRPDHRAGDTAGADAARTPDTPDADDTVDTDVAVVGAGPAGLALSLMLLRSGVRVALVEKSSGDPASAGRDFHGEVLQPGGQRVLDRLGVLSPARARGARRLTGFRLLDRGRVLLDVDYGRLPGPYDHLLALPQRHLLAELLAACRSLPGFRHLPGHRVSALTGGHGRCTGVVATGPGGRRVTVRARVVAGADGRYSKTRALAGIGAGRTEAFDQDVVWFSLPAPGRATGTVAVHRAPGSAVLVHDTHPDRLRVGWTLPHRGWPAVAARGVEAVRAELTAALPQFADLIRDHVRALDDLRLLDVFAAHADTWVRDGLVLLGDAAHTHGPLGAQGVNLALQDAAALHPVLVDALRADDCSRGRLAAFPRLRGPAAEAVTRMQKVQAKALLGAGGPAADVLRSHAARLVGRTPLGTRITRRIAYGRTPPEVRTDLFTVRTPAPRRA
ncbi:FAD-dependent monooxygenase [Streptomyces albogriseolus]|uniref:Monooxygenase n=1 Tax=Streptomyces albogriseolus TaxID=1887 RepID=A0ACC6UES1_STRAO|nr:FAD-dependent monooxygenase [Streptomyces viridodiastaticus]GHG32380.1 FAD-dependent oxidoreductase [Streptomyces viridodiastaticus]